MAIEEHPADAQELYEACDPPGTDHRSPCPWRSDLTQYRGCQEGDGDRANPEVGELPEEFKRWIPADRPDGEIEDGRKKGD
jgi:hypothetical protein